MLGTARGCVYASSLPTLGREQSPSLISHNREAVDRSVCICAFSRSKRSSPFLDKELYSATLNNFLGTEPVILRNLGQQHYSMKSEYLPAWLNGKSENKHNIYFILLLKRLYYVILVPMVDQLYQHQDRE